MKFFFSTVKLSIAVEDDLRPALDQMDCSADMDVAVDKTFQIADRFGIAVKAENEEMAVGIGGLRAAYVEKVNAASAIDDAVYVRGYTDVVICVLRCVVG